MAVAAGRGQAVSGAEWVLTVVATGPGATAGLAEDLVDALPSAAAASGEAVVSVTFSVSAAGAPTALSVGLLAWAKAIGAAKLDIVEVSAATAGHVDDALERPGLPTLLGVAELAARLGVSKARASELARLDGFPRPIARLASGPVWTEPSVSGHLETWRRRPGRPRREEASPA